MKKIFVIVLVIIGSFASLLAQQHKRLTNLPHVYIDTYNHQNITSKNTYIYATMYYVDENDSVARYDSLEIRGRGNSTWSSMGEKKPYKIKFHKKEKFLGKGYANCKPWTLMANTADKALIRNALTSRICDFLGMKNPPAHRFVDFTLNGDYRGNYMISDHVDVRPHRVNVKEQDYPLADTSNISGGYLLEVDGFRDGNHFDSNRGVYLRIHYPDEEEIAPSQNKYIKDYINNVFEAALFSSNFTDPNYGYRAYVDSASLAGWYLTNEISANLDGFYSAYFYKEQDDPKFYWGPCWDYDIAYDNDYRTTPTAEILMTEKGFGNARTWTQQMWKDEWFARLIYNTYKDAYDRGLVDYLYNEIDSMVTLIDASQQLNYQKWGINKQRYHETVLYNSYDQYITFIKDFIQKHTDWLLTTFEQRKPKEPDPPFTPGNVYYRFANKGTGTVFDLVNQDTIDNTAVCCWELKDDRETEDWIIRKAGDYYRITTRHGGMALTDVAEPGVTSVQLRIAEPDTLSERQLWMIVEQADKYVNFKNKYTQQTANLSSGNRNNGASVISYTSNERDATSNNRLWQLIEGDSIPMPVDTIPIDTIPVDTTPVNIDILPDNFDYALAYNADLGYLHFGSEDPSRLTFIAQVFDMQGRAVGRFRTDEQFSVADLPKGVYIVSWVCEGRRRSVKFVR